MPGDIVLGEALLCDVYGEHDVLLLRRGHVISSEHLLEKMMDRGIFVDDADYALFPSAQKNDAAPQESKDTRSSLRLIQQANLQLDQLLAALAEGDRGTQVLSGLQEVAGQIMEAVEINPDVALASILFKQNADGYSARHSVATAIIVLLMAQAMQKTESEIHAIVGAAISMNASLYKLQEVLQSRESGPTPEEAEIIRQHPQASIAILKQLGVTDEAWLAYVHHHHENIDGTGYPMGISGADIPENAKLIATADRYTALIAPRSYRPSILSGEALRSMLMDRGKGIDETMAANFVRVLGIYPPGSFVKLASGEIAIVTKRTKNSRAPIVHALLAPRGSPLPFPHKRETEHERYAIREAVRPDWSIIPFNMQHIWGKEASD
jgi:HD-GYP domain-containing protein (c-di-GMP phosphodiesterase class II)